WRFRRVPLLQLQGSAGGPQPWRTAQGAGNSALARYLGNATRPALARPAPEADQVDQVRSGTPGTEGHRAVAGTGSPCPDRAAGETEAPDHPGVPGNAQGHAPAAAVPEHRAPR